MLDDKSSGKQSLIFLSKISVFSSINLLKSGDLYVSVKAFGFLKFAFSCMPGWKYSAKFTEVSNTCFSNEASLNLQREIISNY